MPRLSLDSVVILGLESQYDSEKSLASYPPSQGFAPHRTVPRPGRAIAAIAVGQLILAVRAPRECMDSDLRRRLDEIQMMTGVVQHGLFLLIHSKQKNAPLCTKGASTTTSTQVQLSENPETAAGGCVSRRRPEDRGDFNPVCTVVKGKRDQASDFSYPTLGRSCFTDLYR